MEERERPDFQQYVPKKVSKIYVLKILLYTIMLVAMGIFLYRKLKSQSKPKVKTQKIEQIDHVKIDSSGQ
jgi:flagellar basal body-associated protein FliL